MVAVLCRQKQAGLMAYQRFQYACFRSFTVCFLVRPTRRIQQESQVREPRRLQ